MYSLKRILGHDRIKHFFTKILENDNWAPFYIFEGPRGVGKATFAHELVKAYNCTASLKPCGECSYCIRISRLKFPDLWVIYPDAFEEYKDEMVEGRIRPKEFDYTASIKIDKMRELKEELSRNPYESGRRFVLIINGENLTVEAQNAMLKMLEETPENTTFIMISSFPERVLSTIRSRARRVRFGYLSENEFSKFDFNSEIPRKLLYRLSGGSIGVAIELLEREEIWQLREEILRLIMDGDEERFLKSSQFLLEKRGEEMRRDLSYFLGLFSSLVRDILILKEGYTEGVINVDLSDELAEASKKVNYESLVRLMERLKKQEVALEKNLPSHLILLPLMRDVH